MADGAPIPADVEALVMERLKPILGRLARLEQTQEEPFAVPRFDPLADLPAPPTEPDWNLVKRHFRRYGNPEATAAKYGIGDPRTESPRLCVHVRPLVYQSGE